MSNHPRFTRKTYEMVAGILHEMLTTDPDLMCLTEVRRMADQFSRVFGRDNPQFSPERFHHAVFVER